MAFVAAAFGQGITTSALSGFVTDKSGRAVAGAAVTVVHEPTGTKVEVLTRPNGQYTLAGLRPGGPYTISVSSSAGNDTRKDVFVDLGEGTTVDFPLGSGEMVKMEAFVVEGERGAVFGGERMSTGSTFASTDIEQVPTVRRNVQDIAQLDTRIALLNPSQDGEMSAQGQNYRFNSFLVDNVQANDPLGLNANGFATLRSPIPPEWLQALSVELNPYDLRRAGFTGALINAVTKSGTNRFSGVGYTEYTDLNMRAKNPVQITTANPPINTRESFRERVWGATIGGPILRDRLFFFLGYDDFRRQTPPPVLTQTLDANQVQQIIAKAKTYNYEPGSLGGELQNVATQKSYLAKVDWNISRAHRLALSYRRVEGQNPVFQFYGGTNTSLSNFWYDARRKTDSYTAQLYSNWSSNFRTEFSFTDSKYDGTGKPRGTPFPQVFINNGITVTRNSDNAVFQNGTLDLGTYAVQQQNNATTKTRNGSFFGEYSLGSHTLIGGVDYQRSEIADEFINNAYGSYTFTTLAAWLAGTPATKTQTVLAPGKTVEDAFGNFTLTTVGVYAEDKWNPIPRLTLTAGLRFDSPYIDETPTTIPTTASYSEASFRSAFGMSSTSSNDGNYTISPRVGFNYRFNTERKTQVRGGLGLFQGTNPAIWLDNAYQNRGVTASVTTTNATFSPSIANTATSAPAVAFINLTDPDFHAPAVWKANAAIDHALPFGGLVLTAEASFLQTRYGMLITDLNLKPVGTNPDGRIRYAGPISATTGGAGRSAAANAYTSSANYQNAGFSDVFKLGNTNKGGGGDVTLKLRRPMKNNWSASLAWTHSHYTEVSPMTATGLAQSFYNTRAVFNPNEDRASTSNYNIPHKVIGQLTYRINYFKKAPTTLSAIWQGRSGRPYSWVYFADANGDGFSFNDLFYVPSGPTDPKVRWTSTTERDNFFAFVNSSTLAKYRGEVVPRNSENSPWVNTIDIRVTQTVQIFRDVRAEVYANLLNVGNLLNDRWGLLNEIPFSYKRAVAGTTHDAATNQYIYTFTPATLNPLPVSTDAVSNASRWQLQVGMRIRF